MEKITTAKPREGSRGGISGVVENVAGNARVASGVTAWMAGDMSISVAKLGKGLGTATLVGGTMIDLYGVNRWIKNPNDPNAVHPAKAGTNLGVGVWGLINPATAVGAAGYYLIDSFYPGRWNGAMENNYRLTQENRAILGPNFNLYNDMGGGW